MFLVEIHQVHKGHCPITDADALSLVVLEERTPSVEITGSVQAVGKVGYQSDPFRGHHLVANQVGPRMLDRIDQCTVEVLNATGFIVPTRGMTLLGVNCESEGVQELLYERVNLRGTDDVVPVHGTPAWVSATGLAIVDPMC